MLQYAGSERGAYAFPQPGTVVELAFAYGLPDQSFIRTVLSLGVGVPALDREEMAWQQDEAVRQRVDAGGNWRRETHGDIREDSLQRLIAAVELLAEYGSEHKKVREHSTEEIGGAKIIEALGALRLLSGGSANLSALDSLNLTTAADINSTAARDQKASVGQDLKEQVGNIAERIATLKQVMKVRDGGTIWVGNESVNVLQVLADLIDVVVALAGTLETHSHPGLGAPPSEQGAIVGHKGDAESIAGDLSSLI
ncbi:hypothetical protein [Microbulbifer litoralis]|uniref:hypothetical protein n=1 Tax=Microbulbifer litoralis TaxID=2933965 RepID=UPI0020284C56|nr:hypothetical protein [Microbulbifer sp. GX H0434]